MISVVDVGCFPHPLPGGGVEESIPQLVDRFQPKVLFGFDPWPDLDEAPYRVGPTLVVPERLAAWVSEGVVDYDPRELGSTVMREKNMSGEWRRPEPMRVRSFDFPAWLAGMILPGERWIVKLDCEGAEFPLLERMRDFGLDLVVDRVLVEWHDHVMEPQFRDRRAALEATLRCTVEQW